MMSRVPFTLFFLCVMILANLLAGTLSEVGPESSVSDWGISHLSVREGDLFRLVSGTFLSHDFSMFVRQVAFAAVVIGMYEWTQGTWRALAMHLSIDIVGTLLVLFAILPGLVMLHPAIDTQALAVFDVGMSAGGFGLIGALVALQKHRWPILLAVCAAIFVKVWISFDPIADSAHFLCLFLGFAAQMALSAFSDKRDVAQL